MKKWVPILVLVAVAIGLLAMMRQHKPAAGFDLQTFGRLPVLLNGRTQPLDSVARNSLLILRGKQTVPGTEGKSLSAIQWLSEVLMRPDLADGRPVFRIDHPELLGLLKLSDNEKFFSLGQFRDQEMELARQAERIDREGIKPEQQTPFEKAVVRLHRNVILYKRLKNSVQPENATDFASELVSYQAMMEPGVKAVRDREAGKAFDQKAFDGLMEQLQRFEMVSRFAYPLLVPSGNPAHNRDDWTNVGLSLMESAREGRIPEPVTFYAQMASAFRKGDAARFNGAVAELRSWLVGKGYQPEIAKGRNEHHFNFLEPFYKASALYVLAFLLAAISWFKHSETLNRTALYLLLLTLLIHTGGLVYRMWLEGRPPVTNLYSSAVFIGWGICLLGILVEWFYRNAIGSVVAALGGFATLVIAHNLSLGGDTMEMMQAVLDTNFWLATHVVVVTLGYAATFMAGFLAILYVVRGVLTTSLSEAMAKSLSRMVYGIICFATLFSFVGTVLGGIWADQSWGRFWGWDPKENGALMIVVWNAFYLHGRWGKILSEKALMATAVFGNVITAFSWFGVNMLGIGLHSYGFMDTAFRWLLLFDVTQLVLVAMALLPLRYWRSFRNLTDGGKGPRAASAQVVRSSV